MHAVAIAAAILVLLLETEAIKIYDREECSTPSNFILKNLSNDNCLLWNNGNLVFTANKCSLFKATAKCNLAFVSKETDEEICLMLADNLSVMAHMCDQSAQSFRLSITENGRFGLLHCPSRKGWKNSACGVWMKVVSYEEIDNDYSESESEKDSFSHNRQKRAAPASTTSAPMTAEKLFQQWGFDNESVYNSTYIDTVLYTETVEAPNGWIIGLVCYLILGVFMFVIFLSDLPSFWRDFWIGQRCFAFLSGQFEQIWKAQVAADRKARAKKRTVSATSRTKLFGNKQTSKSARTCQDVELEDEFSCSTASSISWSSRISSPFRDRVRVSPADDDVTKKRMKAD